MKGSAHELRVFPSLQELLSEIRTEARIDSALLIGAYLSDHGETIGTMLDKHSFEREGEPTVRCDVCATEEATLLYVAFTIELPCCDATDERRVGARIEARGEGTYDADAGRFAELAGREQRLVFQLRDGTELDLEKVVFAHASCVIGHRTVEHTVRYEL